MYTLITDQSWKICVPQGVQSLFAWQKTSSNRPETCADQVRGVLYGNDGLMESFEGEDFETVDLVW